MATIDAVEDTIHELEALLGRYGIAIAASSRLESALLFARKIRDVRRGEQPDDIPDDRPQFRELVGLYDLAGRIVRAERTMRRKFQALVPLLQLFGSTKGQLAQIAPAQLGAGGTSDQDSDRMFELLVALCLLPRVGRLELDEGGGCNPDLLFRFSSGHGWRRWGIACKRLYSSASARYRETVRKAIDQIEKSPAERGLVFVSLVNLVDHDAFYPWDGNVYSGFSKERLIEMLDQQQERLLATVACTDDDLRVEFAGKKAIPGVVHYIGTTYMTGTDDAPVDKAVQRAWSRGRVGPLRDVFQNGLNSMASPDNGR